MTLDPILNAEPIVQLHVATALLAMGLGPLAIFRRKRDRFHKVTGYSWVIAMIVTATSALFINDIRLVGPFSPIHLLIPLVYYSVWRAIAFARAGNIIGHSRAMKSIYVQALGIAGLFTLLPGRLMSDALFAGAPWLGFSAVAGLMVLGFVWAYLRAPSRRRNSVA